MGKKTYKRELAILQNKKVLVFDLDDTLAESKASIDDEMARLLCKALNKRIVAIMGGGSFGQFKKQVLSNLKCKSDLKNLFLLPTSGAKMYKYKKGRWNIVYSNILSAREKGKVIRAIKEALEKINYKTPKKIYGKIIENRESQITFSALGQKAPLREKKRWNQNSDIRQKIRRVLEREISGFEIRLGGLTSIDITKKGIDKSYGIKQLSKFLKIAVSDIVYVGDAIYKGGNDYAVLKSKVDVIKVNNSNDTKNLLEKFLKKY